MTDLARTDRLAALETQVRAHNIDLARGLWRMGNNLREVHRDELWRSAGHASFDAWLSDSGVTGRTTAYKAMRVATVFAEEMAARFGTEKLDAGLSYLSATAKTEKAGDLLAVQIRVRDDDGAWAALPFVDASAVQIRDASAALAEMRRKRALPAALRKRVARVNREVSKSKQGFRSARLRVRRNKAGQVMVTLASVPLEEFDAYVAKVRAGLVVVAAADGDAAGEGEG